MAAGALGAASPAAVLAANDPCTGVGTVTCSGNQSAGIDTTSPTFPAGTTVLNVNALTSNIAPTNGSGQPGILFFGAGDITLNSATGPFRIITSENFVDGIVAVTDGGIKLTSSGDIAIKGVASNGINALSFLAGAIDIASASNISLANGGNGILATSDGTVDVTSSGAISVTGEGAGISASAGNHVTVISSGSISVSGDGDAIDALDIGGRNGVGGVTVISSGALSLAGNNAIGINASSNDTDLISVTSSGGISLANGGNAILAFGLGAVTVSSSGGISIAGSLGGAGITAVSGGDGAVSLTSSGGISIAGDGAGIAAASEGAGTVSVTSSGGISILGNGAAIVAVSGSAAANVNSSGNMFVGGSGAGITAVGVTGASVSSSGTISIGGAGNAISAISADGAASVTSSGSISLGGDGAAIGAFSDGAASVNSSGTIFVGGKGDAIDAEGKVVRVASSGAILVANDGAGITAKGASEVAVSSSGAISIGGAGTGIDAEGNAVQVSSSGNISVANGGAGITAKGAGAIAVTSSGAISIGGAGAGIDAEGNAVQVNSSGNISVANGGTGIKAAGVGNAAVSASGRIAALGAAATGIDVRSTNGPASVASSGDVAASGANATAIRASAAGGGVAVTISGGTITGGSGTGAGVALVGGAGNTLANFGSIATSVGLAGTAILGTAIPASPASAAVIGNNVVSNAGTVIGNVDLGPGRNAFNNLPGGVFNTGATVALGAGGALSNSGNLSPGGSGVIQTTTLTGNLTQGSAGKISVDLNPATGQADRINATGGATLGGQVVVNLLNATPTTGGTTVTLVHAVAGAADNGLALGALPAVAAYQLAFPNGTDVALQGGLNFAPAGLNANQAAIGGSINSIQLAGGSASFQPVVNAILTIPDVSGLRQAYDQLSPEAYADNEIADFYSGLRFANSLMSCSVADGRYAFIKEGQCVWAQIGGKFLNLGADSDSLGFSESAVAIAGGAEFRLLPDWYADFAVGYDNGNISTASTLAKSSADRAHFGAAVKYNPGPFLFSAAVFGGYGWYSTDRTMNFGGFNATALSDSRISRVGGQLRAAYLIDRETWYLKPLIDLNLTRVSLNSFNEQGAGGASLLVSGAGETVFSASPAVEVGTQTSLQGGALLRPFARLGVSVFSNTDFAVGAAFGGAPAGASPFSVSTGIDPVTADVAVGADLFLPDSRFVFKLAYNGHYGARVRDQGFTLKASIRF